MFFIRREADEGYGRVTQEFFGFVRFERESRRGIGLTEGFNHRRAFEKYDVVPTWRRVLEAARVYLRPNLFCFFSAGFKIWNEHSKLSSTLIIAPALSNSPQ